MYNLLPYLNSTMWTDEKATNLVYVLSTKMQMTFSWLRQIFNYSTWSNRGTKKENCPSLGLEQYFQYSAIYIPS